MIDYEYFYIYDKPVKYYLENSKKNILIHPIKVKDYLILFSTIDCLTINKNRIPDINIIKMSYLEYIYTTILSEIEVADGDITKSNMLIKFISLMSLCLNINPEQINLYRTKDEKIILSIHNYLYEDDTDNVEINSEQFDEIKRIICDYNMVSLPDENIDPKLESALEEARAFRAKNHEKMGSLEDQFCCIMVSTPLKMEDINELTIRKFQKILERVDHKLHYQLYKTAEMNGAEFKEKISHWMAEIKHDKYNGLLVDYDTTVDKFTQK